MSLSSLSTKSAAVAGHLAFAEKACKFLTASTDPFHAVANSIKRLEEAGFQGLASSAPFSGKLQPGGKYYYTVEHSTLVAFTIGPKVNNSTFGFHIIGGHTDSPNLKVKPRSLKSSSGCQMLAVECYGGGLWHTWFDRDLSISGRVLVRSSNENNNTIQQRLVQLKDPVARISTLCIHLQSAEERQGFAVNKENHTAPIIATTDYAKTIAAATTTTTTKITDPANEAAKTTLEQQAQEQIDPVSSTSSSASSSSSSWRDGQEPLLLQAIAEELKVDITDILDFELNLYDTQPATLGGMQKEFLYSARLDNLATVFCSIEAIADAPISNDATDISMVVAFDHEEVGSSSAQGAGSPVMQQAVQRITAALHNNSNTSNTVYSYNPDWYNATIRKSFILSIDQAHAIHPNYASKHESNHAPKLNAGIVIKTNSNQRYATNGLTGFVVRELGRRANIPIQEFVVRNDCPCGSTIGPIVSENTGIRTVDAGMPQLSMHSCREVMGIADLSYGYELFKTFFTGFRELDDQISKDIQP